MKTKFTTSVGNYVQARTLKNGGRHVKITSELNPLNYKKGITDVWCSTNPTTKEKMLYLEDKDGNLIREFNLSHQMEQVRDFFQKINRDRSKSHEYLDTFKAYENLRKAYDKQISVNVLGHGDYEYIVAGKKFNSKPEALKELLKDNPESINIIDRYTENISKFNGDYKMPWQENTFIKTQI